MSHVIGDWTEPVSQHGMVIRRLLVETFDLSFHGLKRRVYLCVDTAIHVHVPCLFSQGMSYQPLAECGLRVRVSGENRKGLCCPIPRHSPRYLGHTEPHLLRVGHNVGVD